MITLTYPKRLTLLFLNYLIMTNNYELCTLEDSIEDQFSNICTKLTETIVTWHCKLLLKKYANLFP